MSFSDYIDSYFYTSPLKSQSFSILICFIDFFYIKYFIMHENLNNNFFLFSLVRVDISQASPTLNGQITVKQPKSIKNEAYVYFSMLRNANFKFQLTDQSNSLLFNTENIVTILHKHSTQSSIILNSFSFYAIATT